MIINYLIKSYFEFFGHYMVKYFKEFNKHKLTPTRYYFEKLLQNDKRKFTRKKKVLENKKTQIDNLISEFNEALNFEGCNSIIGLILRFLIKIFFLKFD